MSKFPALHKCSKNTYGHGHFYSEFCQFQAKLPKTGNNQKTLPTKFYISLFPLQKKKIFEKMLHSLGGCLLSNAQKHLFSFRRICLTSARISVQLRLTFGLAINPECIYHTQFQIFLMYLKTYESIIFSQIQKHMLKDNT